jgi:hypothetical protein
MKRNVWKRFGGVILGSVVVAATVIIAEAVFFERSAAEGDLQPIVCPSRLQLRHPKRCSSGGARDVITELAVEGLYPQHPLPVARVEENLGDVPYTYLKSGRKDSTPVYSSLEDALKKKNPFRSVEPGFVFFSWIDLIRQDNQVVYMISPGVYVRGDNLSRIALPSFQGIALQRTPDRPFAWVLNRLQASTEPGSGQPKKGRFYNRYDVVWVYDVEQVGDLDWYKVGPDAWIEQRMMAVMTPSDTKPEGVLDERWISINLYEQTLGIYENGNLVYATLVSSGLKGWWTQPGVFQVYKKYEKDFMGGAFEADRSDYYYLEDVPWILYFDEARALHGAYWHNGFGYPRSHGCVNLSLADANWIFNWAEEGTYVEVFDPSPMIRRSMVPVGPKPHRQICKLNAPLFWRGVPVLVPKYSAQ